MDETLRLLRSHVSVRDFAPQAVPEARWKEILRAAQQASTDATGQLYSAIELRDATLRRDVIRLIGDQPFLERAPKLLLLCVDVRRIRLLLEHRGERFGMRLHSILLFGLTDLGLFAQNLATACEAAGLGIVFLGSVQNNSRAIAKRLRLPAGVVPMYGLAAGVPSSRANPKPRLPTAAVVHVDGYRDPSPAELDEMYQAMAPATRSGDWVNPLRKYFAQGGIMDQREEEIAGLFRDQQVT